MGFVNLLLTVTGHASAADISTITVLSLPAHLCLPSPPGFGRQPETVQRALPRLDGPRPIKHKKGAPKHPQILVLDC